MTLLSGSAVCTGIVAGTYVGSARFELFLLLPEISGVEVSGAEVSVSASAVGVAPAPAGGAVHLALSFGTEVKDSGLFG